MGNKKNTHVKKNKGCFTCWSQLEVLHARYSPRRKIFTFKTCYGWRVCARQTHALYTNTIMDNQFVNLQLYMLEVMVNLRRRYELQFENIGNLMENITSSIIHLLTTTTTVGEHGVYVYIYLSHCNYKKKINKELSLQGKKRNAAYTSHATT